MAFIFDYSADLTNHLVYKLQDKRSFPIYNISQTLGDVLYALNASGHPYLEITAELQMESYLPFRLLQVVSNDDELFCDVKHIEYINTDSVFTCRFYLYDEISNFPANATAFGLTWTEHPFKWAQSRSMYAIFHRFTKMWSSLPEDIEVAPNGQLNEATEYVFEQQEGGYFKIIHVAIERYRYFQYKSNTIINGANIFGPVVKNHFIVGEFTWDMVNGEQVFYRCLQENDDSNLQNLANWEPIAVEDILIDDLLKIAVNQENITFKRYNASRINLFVVNPLQVGFGELMMNSECNCLDPCNFPSEIKISLLLEQIRIFGNKEMYSRAQKSYEKAMSLLNETLTK